MQRMWTNFKSCLTYWNSNLWLSINPYTQLRKNDALLAKSKSFLSFIVFRTKTYLSKGRWKGPPIYDLDHIEHGAKRMGGKQDDIFDARFAENETITRAQERGGTTPTTREGQITRKRKSEKNCTHRERLKKTVKMKLKKKKKREKNKPNMWLQLWKILEKRPNNQFALIRKDEYYKSWGHYKLLHLHHKLRHWCIVTTLFIPSCGSELRGGNSAITQIYPGRSSPKNFHPSLWKSFNFNILGQNWFSSS